MQQDMGVGYIALPTELLCRMTLSSSGYRYYYKNNWVLVFVEPHQLVSYLSFSSGRAVDIVNNSYDSIFVNTSLVTRG